MRVPEKILVIRLSSVGDIILTSPLLRCLRARFPGARIDVLVKSEYIELVKFNPHVTNVIQLAAGTRGELSQLKNDIRDTGYDCILDLHNSLRSRWLRSFAGARRVRVVNKRVLRRLALVKWKKNLYRSVVPVADRYIETASSLGVENDGGGLEIHVPEEIRLLTDSKLSRFSLGPDAAVIGLVPGARHFTKRWPQERFVEIGVRLAKIPSAKLLLFGSKEEELACSDIAQLINSASGSGAAVNLAGKLSLLETAVAFDACRVVVTNDTGLMHLAAARKRKIVAIFGSTVKEFGFFPYGTENIVLENPGLACRPCTHIGRPACPLGHFNCMNQITAEDVLLAVSTISKLKLWEESSHSGSVRDIASR
jgi:heptosyltransferase-2